MADGPRLGKRDCADGLERQDLTGVDHPWPDAEAQPPAGSSSVRSCWTGSKKYCCRRGQRAGGVPISFARQRLTLGVIRTGVGKCLDVHAPD